MDLGEVNKKHRSSQRLGYHATTMPADHQQSNKRRASDFQNVNQGNIQDLRDSIQELTELCAQVRESAAQARRQTERDSKNVSLMLGSIHAQESAIQNMAAVLDVTTVQLRAQEGKSPLIGTASREDRKDMVDLQDTVKALQAQVHQLEIRIGLCNCDS